MKGFLVLVLMLSGTATAMAAAPSPSPVPSSVVKTPAKRSTARATTRAPQSAAVKTAKGSTAKPTPTKSAPHEGPRTLQDIHIEGEIPVPQVLFITARDQRRFLDFKHRRYLKTSQQVGEQTGLPSWIGVTGQQPTDAGKENPR